MVLAAVFCSSPSALVRILVQAQAALEKDCPPELEAARQNRRLLYHLMASVGLVNYSSEWWHFAYGERQWAARTGKAPIYGFCPECDF